MTLRFYELAYLPMVWQVHLYREDFISLQTLSFHNWCCKSIKNALATARFTITDVFYDRLTNQIFKDDALKKYKRNVHVST